MAGGWSHSVWNFYQEAPSPEESAIPGLATELGTISRNLAKGFQNSGSHPLNGVIKLTLIYEEKERGARGGVS